MATHGEPLESAAQCPACGAVMRPGATICASCGTETASVTASARAAIDPQLPLAASETSMIGTGDVAADPDPGSSQAVPTQRCEWCGAENPVGAMQCAACHALFARPEQDAALRRDLDERLREEQVANEMYASRRRGLWRLFAR